MDELCRQGQQRCYASERRTLLFYSSVNSDSEDSVARVSRVLGKRDIFGVFDLCAEIFNFGAPRSKVEFLDEQTLSKSILDLCKTESGMCKLQ